MPNLRSYGCRFAPALMLLAMTGCQDKTTPVDTLPRRAVSGTVTLDGKPLAVGKIQFEPTGSDKGAIAAGDITDGKYSIDRAQGPTPGKYRVIISGIPTVKIKEDEQPGGPPKRQADPVPAKYNTKSTLTKEIADASSNQFDFPLESK
jgi:hypothetical protein